MRRNHLQAGMLAVAYLFATESFSRTIWVYGLANAQDYAGKGHGKYYIQLGSFNDKLNAYRYSTSIQAKTKYKVKIELKNRNYLVIVGPLKSAAEVREVGMKFRPTERVKSVVVTKSKSGKKVGVVKTVYETKPKTVVLPSQFVGEVKPDHSGWYISADFGAQWNSLGNRMLVYNGSDFPPPENVDLYFVNQNHQYIVAVSGGYRWERDCKWLPAYSLGLRYKHVFAKNVGQSIMQYSEPDFLNYTYDWKIYSDVLLASTKLNIVQYKRFLPYVTGGVGGARNKAGSYKETANPGITPRISPGFANKSTARLAYNVGAGIDFQVTPQILMTMGYEYQNLGNVSSGSGVYTWAGQALNLGSYQSNAALLSVSYLLGER